MATQHDKRHVPQDRPSQHPRAPSLLVKTEDKKVFIEGHVFQLVAESKTVWQVIDLGNGHRSWIKIGAHASGGYEVREASDRMAESVGAAWIWGCGQTARSPLPPRPSLH